MRNRTVASRPDPEREKAATGSGPVKSWKMSPEELEDYRARTGYKAPTDAEGKEVSQPVQDKSVRPEPLKEPVKPSKAGRKSAKEPDKQAFLRLIAAGESIAAAERRMGLKINGMYYWLKKWDLIGINPDKARDLLDIQDEVQSLPETTDAPDVPLLRSTSPAAQSVEAKAAEIKPKGAIGLNELIYQQEIERLEKRMEEAQRQATKAWSEVEGLRDRIADYESELTRWVQEDNEKTLRISELQEDRDQWKRQFENFRDMLDKAEGEIAELQEELQLSLSALEDAANADNFAETAKAISADNVNHPAHYTAGGIETIDFIRAKLMPDEFVGYCKGNVIKYVTRATLKGGIEDLRKAGKYIEFATDGGEQG